MAPNRIVFCLAVSSALLCIPRAASGGLFGEHKAIGDSAFARFLAENNNYRFFHDTLGVEIRRNAPPYALFTDKFALDTITYGDLTGLSGDHDSNPLDLYDALLSRMTKMSQTLVAQLKGIRANRKGASDIQLTFIDLFYPFRAIIDESHFYRLGESFREQLSAVDTSRLISLRGDLAGGNSEEFQRLLEVNAPAKYAMLHAMALDVMSLSGQLLQEGSPPSVRYALELFELGLMLNAFGDHFLEDAFAGGHLAVRRTLLTALDNKGTHDYYNRVGLRVTNARGQTWIAYGDGFIEPDDSTFLHAVEANTISLNELWEAFVHGADGRPAIIDRMAQSGDVPGFILQHFKAFECMPLPVDPSLITTGDSRNGSYYAAAGGWATQGSGASRPVAGVKIGVGLNVENAPKDDRARESLQWYALDASFMASSQWRVFRFGLEGIFSDRWCAAMQLGSLGRNGVWRFAATPSVGFEYKPVTWSVAPSLHLEWSAVARMTPLVSLELDIRYY